MKDLFSDKDFERFGKRKDALKVNVSVRDESQAPEPSVEKRLAEHRNGFVNRTNDSTKSDAPDKEQQSKGLGRLAILGILLLILVTSMILIPAPHFLVGHAVEDYVDNVVSEEVDVEIQEIVYDPASHQYAVSFKLIVPNTLPSGKPVNASFPRTIKVSRAFQPVDGTYQKVLYPVR